MRPDISCIMTCYNEGALLAKGVQSVLDQTHGNFELIVVSDGADAETEATLAGFDDPRIKVIAQDNDGLSAARNTGLAQATGRIICFLDADDTRPPSVFAQVVAAFDRHAPDVMLSTGFLRELRFEDMPFYDAEVIAEICGGQPETLCRTSHDTGTVEKLCLIEPQSANKFISKDFLDRIKLRFPPGLFFEDMFFHAGLIANAGSVLVSQRRTFTYFRRYRRDQITSGTGRTRFDALSVAAATLTRFETSPLFHSGLTRTLLFLAIAKQVEWSSKTLSHEFRDPFRKSWAGLLATLNGLYFSQLSTPSVNDYARRHGWMTGARDFILAHKG